MQVWVDLQELKREQYFHGGDLASDEIEALS